jgi:hypothetical protein
MTTVRNTADSRRVFSRINRSTGCWLELDPGEEAEVDLPEGYKLDDDLMAVADQGPKPAAVPPATPEPDSGSKE